MGILHDLGVHVRPPPNWNRWWILMWGIATSILLTLAFVLPVTWSFGGVWIGAALVLFGIPQWIGVRDPSDRFPPLTHTIRHFLPNYLAFPLIYGVLGAVGARWLVIGFPRFWGVGAMFALLGWLTDHFTITYARPDPHPHAYGVGEEAPGVRMPAPIEPPVILQPRPF